MPKKKTCITLDESLLKWSVLYFRQNETSLSGMINKTLSQLSASISEKDKETGDVNEQ